MPTSKGKRSKKRKRKDGKLKGEDPELTRPSPPEISSSVFVGLNNITRNLETLSRKSKHGHDSSLDDSLAKQPEVHDSPSQGGKVSESSVMMENKSRDRHFSAVFVLSSSLPSVLQEHLPQLVTTASLAHPSLPATRLVQLPKGCESRLCANLGLPRASAVGILDGAPHSGSLIDLVREQVPEVHIAWLQEARKHEYQAVKIKTVETFGWVAEKESKSS